MFLRPYTGTDSLLAVVCEELRKVVSHQRSSFNNSINYKTLP